MAFEWKEFIKRFHYAQYDERKLIRDLQLQVDELNANLKAVADYFGATDLRLDDLEEPDTPHNHDDRYYTEAETDSLLSGKSDIGHNHDSRYYTETEIDAMLAAIAVDPWAAQPIGVPIPLWDHITGVTAPSTSNPAYRYIKLTASDSYNTGVLTSQSSSGSAPNLIVTAVVSLTGSPIDGQTVALINSDRRIIKGGNSGAKEQSANLSHGHTGITNTTGAHQHSGAVTTNFGASGATFNAAADSLTSSAGNHSHTLIIDANGTTESRPANIGATYYMRIK